METRLHKVLAVMAAATFVVIMAFGAVVAKYGQARAEPVEDGPATMQAMDRAAGYPATPSHTDDPYRKAMDGIDQLSKKIGEVVAQLETSASEEEGYEEEYYGDGSYDGGYYGGGEYEMPYSDMYNTDGPSQNMPGWYDGHVETAYNASGHYMASEWTLDDEGFYHDSEGRYVVGVSINEINPDTGETYQYGDVIQTGAGEAVVYDYGYGVSNVRDFATAW